MQKIAMGLMLVGSMGAGPCDFGDQPGDVEGEETADTETDDCGTESCAHRLLIHVLLAGEGAFESGTYTFSVVAPDESVYAIDCEIRLPEEGLLCTTGHMTELEAFLDAGLREIFFLVHGAPPYLTLRVDYNDYPIYDQILTPDYDIVYPNGEDCEPACHQGEEYIAVSIW